VLDPLCLAIAGETTVDAARSIDSPLSRRDRRKREVHTRVLEAAVALFDEQGFAATKVADICEQADVAHKTFFNHFQSKQHLVSEIARDALEQLFTQIDEARHQPGSTRQRLHYFFSTIADNAEAAGPMHRELVTEIIHVAHEAGAHPEQAHRLHAAFGALVQDGRAAGDVTRRHDAATLTEMIIGAFYVLMFDWANLESYPLRQRALAAARFLGDAISTPSRRARG
jgi:AcrR family transcriptional regulator